MMFGWENKWKENCFYQKDKHEHVIKYVSSMYVLKKEWKSFTTLLIFANN